MNLTDCLPAMTEPRRLWLSVRMARTTSFARARQGLRHRIAIGPALLVADTFGVYRPQAWPALGR